MACPNNAECVDNLGSENEVITAVRTNDYPMLHHLTVNGADLNALCRSE